MSCVVSRINGVECYWPAKQRKGRIRVERLRVPAVLAGLLESYAASCAEQGMERLFPYSRRWVLDHVKRLCKLAGVPEICAHAMRGTHPILATEAGATGEMVAKQLSHSSPHVTRAHYIQGSGEDDSRNARVARQLDGPDSSDGDGGASSEGILAPWVTAASRSWRAMPPKGPGTTIPRPLREKLPV